MNTCPVPLSEHKTIQMAHGGGGRLMRQLIDQIFVAGFDNEILDEQSDSAVLDLTSDRLAFTTDSYVVQPLFFPGADIGKLAVCGTANDLAMAGARPVYLSAGFILEEGLSVALLSDVVRSMRQQADTAGIRIVTGDTKVVDRGKGDGIFINTSGIGVMSSQTKPGPSAIREGDAILLSGDLGRHGIAVMTQRDGLTFESPVESDCDHLWPVVHALQEHGVTLHCLRDLTRGGLASALVEVAESARLRLHVSARAIPVRDDVRGACELLGLDPYYVANEGRMIVIVPQAEVEQALICMREQTISAQATCIGRIDGDGDGRVTIESEIGVKRILDMLSGEQLPRIC